MFKSVDSGASWTAVNTGLPLAQVVSLAFDASPDPAVFAAPFRQGLYQSANDGSTWTPAGDELGDVTIQSLAVHPSTAGVMYAATEWNGVYKTIDAGETWQSLENVVFLSSFDILALTVAPGAPQTILAATDSAFFLSRDDGQTWNRMLSSVFFCQTSAAAPSLQHTGRVYAGCGQRVIVSEDYGVNWASPAYDFPSVVLSLATQSEHGAKPPEPYKLPYMFAGLDGNGVHRRDEATSSWTAANTGLSNLHVHALAVDPWLTNVVYAGTEAGIFKSTDGGGHWTKASGTAGSASISGLTLNQYNPAVIYAVTSAGVMKSTNRGVSWSLANSGLGSRIVYSVAVHPLFSSIVFIGTDNGVYRSVDGGATWAEYNQGWDTVSPVHTLTGAGMKPPLIIAGSEKGVHVIDQPVQSFHLPAVFGAN